MKEYAFGIDLGGTTAKVGLFTTSGALLEKWEVPTDTSNAGEHILENLANAIRGKMAEKEIPAEQVEGVGIGVPGPVLNSSVVPIVCANLGGWGERNVSAQLSGLLDGLRVLVGNDANVAALGLRFSAVALSAALPQPVLTGALSATASPSCSWTRRSRMRCSMGSSTKVWMMRARSRSQTASHLPTSNNWGAVQFREKHSCALLRFLLCVKTWIIRMLAASMTRCGVGRGSAAPS